MEVETGQISLSLTGPFRTETTYGRTESASVVFGTPFSRIPDIFINLKAYDTTTGFPSGFKGVITAKTTTGFTITCTSYNNAVTTLLAFNYYATVIPFDNIRYEYITQNINLPATQTKYIDVAYSSPLVCVDVVSTVYPTGFKFTSGKHEIQLTVSDNSQLNKVQVKVKADEAVIEFVSFLVISTCKDDSQSFTIGQTGITNDLSTGVFGGRGANYEHVVALDDYQMTIHGQNWFKISNSNVKGTRINYTFNESTRDKFSAHFYTWADTAITEFYLNVMLYNEQSCEYQCQACKDIASQCTACSDVNRDLTKSCDCKDTFYDNNVPICLTCDYKCGTCETTSTNCLSCANQIRDLNTGCLCKDSYYELPLDPICYECDDVCLTCQNSSSECIICSGSLSNKIAAPSCFCENNFYMTQFFDCLQCNHECALCENIPSNCTQCKVQPNRRTTTSDCSCMDGFYEDTNKDCIKCPLKCSKCSDQNTCTECTVQVNIFRDDLSQNCNCQDGYYEDGVQSLICQECPFLFEKCLGDDTAIKCKDGFMRLDQTQKCICADNYFDNGVDIDCQLCEYPCSNCEYSSKNCITCSNGLNRNSAPNCGCKDGFYDDFTQCIECSSKCNKCLKSAEFCTECADTQTRNNDSECSCKKGYKEIGQAQCGQCDIGCKSCQGEQSTCTICELGKFRTLITPQCGCKEGYYEIESQIDCIQCSYKCKSCNQNKENCLVCQNNKLLPPLCEQYKLGNVIVIDSENSQSQTIKGCNHECETCRQNEDNCLSCIAGKNRIQSPPLCQCLPGYHDENNTLTDCQQCPLDCIKCPNSKYCYECATGLNRVLNNFSGKCECQQGFKENPRTLKCQICYQLQEQCVLQCPEQNFYTDQKNQQCISIQEKSQSIQNLIFLGGFILAILLPIFLFVFYIQFNGDITLLRTQSQSEQANPQKLDEEKKTINNDKNEKNLNKA